MTTRVFKRNGKVTTETGYNKEFVEFARSKKAKWDGKYWNFSEEFENEVTEKVTEIYGKYENTKYNWDNKSDIYFDLVNNQDLKITFNEVSTELQNIFRTTDFRFAEREGKVILFFDSLGIENADNRKNFDFVGLDPSGYTVDFEKEILTINNNAEFKVFKNLYQK